MLLPRRTRWILLAIAAPILLTGCARTISDASPEEIPTLRARLEANPEDGTTATRLGIALYKAGDNEASRDLLATVTGSGDAVGAAWLYLGLAQEGLEEWSAARTAYQQYLDAGRYGPLLGEIRDRLQLMVRRELQTEAQAALAAEDELTDAEPAPRSIAVFPFQLISDREELSPLRIALADMMITDLSVSNALTVLERTQIQSLLDEMAMTEAGLVEEASGARAGRLLRAEHVVQGALTTVGTDAIRFDADVLNTVSRASAGQVANEDLLEQIFDLEKQAVFQVLDVLGVELTPAERQAIDENRSDNLLAFLTYGQGLEALDRGDYAAAAGLFNQALQLDPAFNAAQTSNSEAAALESAEGTSSESIEQQASNEMGGGVTAAPPEDLSAVGGLNNTLNNVGNAVNPNPTGGTIDLGNTGGSGGDGTGGTTRQPVQESGGGEGTTEGTKATIKISIPRPGGVPIFIRPFVLGRLIGGGR